MTFLDSYLQICFIFQLIVATEPDEIPRLENLLKRGIENGVKDLRMIEASEIKDIEPNCVVSVGKI